MMQINRPVNSPSFLGTTSINAKEPCLMLNNQTAKNLGSAKTELEQDIVTISKVNDLLQAIIDKGLAKKVDAKPSAADTRFEQVIRLPEFGLRIKSSFRKDLRRVSIAVTDGPNEKKSKIDFYPEDSRSFKTKFKLEEANVLAAPLAALNDKIKEVVKLSMAANPEKLDKNVYKEDEAFDAYKDVFYPSNPPAKGTAVRMFSDTIDAEIEHLTDKIQNAKNSSQTESPKEKPVYNGEGNGELDYWL